MLISRVNEDFICCLLHLIKKDREMLILVLYGALVKYLFYIPACLGDIFEYL